MNTRVVYTIFIVSVLIIAIAPSGVLGKKPAETPSKKEGPKQASTSSNNGKAIGKNKQTPDEGSSPTPPPESTIPPPPEPIIEINLYTDQDCTTPLTSVDWERITAGTTSTMMIYLKNEGDITVTAQLFSENWTPSATSDYMQLG